MSHRQDPEILAGLRERFDSNPAVHFDFDIRNSDSLRKADVMISDWSGSAFEFAFGFERPVLFVDTEPKVNNADFAPFMAAQSEPLAPVEENLRETLGALVSPDCLDRVHEKIRNLLVAQDETHQRLVETRDRTIYNLGQSSVMGADRLIEIIENS
jgi:YidC/Oxa1 family membrane protein insertase